ncbi:hypothetical protein E6O75_ATG09335 [Venturia nashicola]|uniref:Uncharacterized protein n=1 Tax=Venturia nashicola TaxID=86259 RepID=A0A4Z1P1U8_9PEZI|nr:hypothetical protein E6O75_ATG09335 [Venturia nashicola]
MSNGSRAPTRPSPAMTKADHLASAPGVMSMLRSSTELGTDSLMMPGPRFAGHNNRPPGQNRHSGGATSRLSTGSGQSQSSRRTSNHRQWPSVSSAGRRRSMTSNFSNLNVPHYLDTLPPNLANLSDHTIHPPPAPHFRDGGRSLSLTSSTHLPTGLTNYRSMTSLRGHEQPYHRPRSPYKYPTRLKRPGYRPSSPALSDMSGIGSSKTQHVRLGSGLRMAQPGLHSHHGPHTYGGNNYGPHAYGGNNHGPHAHGGHNYHPQTHMQRPGPSYSGLRNHSIHSVASVGTIDRMPGTFPPSLPGSRQGTPSIPDHPLPALTPTHPLSAQYGASSSEPSSSSPQTPKDMPLLPERKPSIMPNRPMLREYSSVSANAPIYYDYSEHFEESEQMEKQIIQTYQETTSAPIPMGFVHRIKTILEDRGMTATPAHYTPTASFLQLPNSEIHELPATPVLQRVTRDLILAHLEAPPSRGQQSEPPSQGQSHHVDFRTSDMREAPQSTVVPPSGQPETTPQGHEKQGSASSDVVSYRSSTTTATVAIDYALHYSMPMSTTNSLHSNMDIFMPGDQTDGDSNTASEGPNEPVTIVTAEVEVAAPTPTQTHWTPRFQTPIDSSRAQSAFVPSSIFSGAPADSSGRYSTPATRNDWMPSEPADYSILGKPEYTKLPTPPVAPSNIEPVEPSHSPPPTPHIEVEQPTQEVDMRSPVSPLAGNDSRSVPLENLSPVSPLVVADNDTNRRDSNTTTHLTGIWSNRKSLQLRSESPASSSTRASFKEAEPSRDQSPDHNSVTDLRFSILRPLTRPLDDVKEEPTLENSAIDLRAANFKFPLPQRKSSMAHFEEFRLSRDSRRHASETSSKDSAFRHRSRAMSEQRPTTTSRPPSGAMSLADMRAIPSLNFSRVDLFDRLNEDFGINTTEKVSEHVAQEEKRPRSSGRMREKYRSFFQSLEEMTNQTMAQIEIKRQSRDLDDDDPSRARSCVSQITRPFSPHDLIAELDRISIPSITGLTQRLSELLPSLKRYYGEEGEPLDDDETIKSALDEIRRLGSQIPSSLFEDFSESELTSTDHSKSAAGLSIVTEENTTGTTVNTRGIRPRSASSPDNNTIISIAELEAPSPAVLRSRSLSDGQIIGTVFNDTEAALRGPTRSLRGSPAESRPWNLDTSYPWALDAQNVDISLPAPVLRRDVIRPRPSRLRMRDDICEPVDLCAVSDSAITGGLHENPTESTGPSVDTVTFSGGLCTTRRKTSKRSIMGSISRKIGLKTSIDHSGFAMGPDILRGEERAVDPGDRYPTTGLSPPSALNIDEVRSFFSDDSSHHDAAARGVSFRKRFTNFKTRLPPISRAQSAMEHRSTLVQGPTIHRSNSLFVSHDGSSRSMGGSTAVAYGDGVGMPRTEFRAKKLVERMKTLWYKGGEMLRSLSRKKKAIGIQHVWDSSGESAHWSNE